MAFTKALYYPAIDISNEQWLKNAMLFWDTIQTIVPSSLEKPYNNYTTKAFEDEGLLLPYYVNSGMPEIESISDDVINYLDSPEALAIFNDHYTKGDYIHPEKLPHEVKKLFDNSNSLLKITNKIFNNNKHDGFYRVNSQFSNYYMTLLAKNISEKIGVGLLTDSPLSNSLSNLTRLDSYVTTNDNRCYPDGRQLRNKSINTVNKLVSSGCLASIILKDINIDPETSVASILRFRRDHSDELARFRVEIDKLTKSLDVEQPYEALLQNMRDIVINKINPSINDLKIGLKEHSINWLHSFLIVTATTTNTIALPSIQLGLPVPIAFGASIGISVIISAVNFNTKRKKILRENPYTYLYELKNRNFNKYTI